MSLLVEIVGFCAMLVTMLFYVNVWNELRLILTRFRSTETSCTSQQCESDDFTCSSMVKLSVEAPISSKDSEPFFPSFLFSSLFLSCLSLVLYGLYRQEDGPDVSMIVANGIGLCLATYCLAILYSRYVSSNSVFATSIESNIVWTAVVSVILTAWQVIQPLGYNRTRFVTGMASTILLWLCFCSPMADLYQAWRTSKPNDTVSPTYILISWSVSFLWLVYGMLLSDFNLILQNLVGIILCTLEAIIFLYFWMKKHEKGVVSGLSSPRKGNSPLN